jgi:glycine/D-amino acid oxidase-like deaminating enzyme
MIPILPKIVIAGGGVVGTSIAYFLARNYNMPVILVDPVGIAPGASGKAGGLLARDWRDGTPLQEIQRQGFDLHQDLANELQKLQSNPKEIDYRRLTCAAVAIDESAEIVRKPRSKKLKDIEWVDENVVMGSVPMGDESSIAQVHPRKLCEALWHAAKTQVGSTLQRGRIVRAILKDPTSSAESNSVAIQAVELDSGQILPADKLVIACGPWTHQANQWFREFNANSGTSIRIPDVTGVKCHSILVKSPKVLSQAVFFEGDGTFGDGDLEVYPRPDGDCYVNGFPDEEEFVTEWPGEESLDRAALDLLQKAMEQTASKELFQGKGTIVPHTEQVCYWPETIDGLPLIGPLPGVDEIFVATGHSVWGILQGPATGRAMAELIMEGESKSLDLSLFGLERFQLVEDFGSEVAVN